MKRLISSLLLSVTAAPERGTNDDGLGKLAEAADRMSPEAATYARAAVENWPTAERAEHRLPSKF